MHEWLSSSGVILERRGGGKTLGFGEEIVCDSMFSYNMEPRGNKKVFWGGWFVYLKHLMVGSHSDISCLQWHSVQSKPSHKHTERKILAIVFTGS